MVGWVDGFTTVVRYEGETQLSYCSGYLAPVLMKIMLGCDWELVILFC